MLIPSCSTHHIYIWPLLSGDRHFGSIKYIALYKEKVNEIQKESIKKVMEHVAPGQGDSLQKLLFPEKDVVDDIPLEIKNLHDVFNASNNNNEKCAILSLIPHSYSKSEIMKMFNCSRYLVDKAKKTCFEQLNDSVTKSRFDTEKARHFIDFLFSSGAIQEVAYGTTVLKFDEIEAQRIPKTVLTVMKSHAICLYRQYCESLNYISLSDSSLYIILSELKLNQQKALSGLDNITAAGLLAINNLIELVKKDRLTITSDEKS